MCLKCGCSLEGKRIPYCFYMGQIEICIPCWEKLDIEEKLYYSLGLREGTDY